MERKMYEKISRYTLTTRQVDGHTVLIRDGKILLPDSKVSDTINSFYQLSKGDGAKKLTYTLKRKYYGIGEKSIQAWLRRSNMHQKKRPAFKNKAPLKPIIASKIFERHQIDTVDMSSVAVQDSRYILSIIDVFSRFLWIRPLTNKKASTIAEVAREIYEEWGWPEIIQCDRGTEFRSDFEKMCTK